MSGSEDRVQDALAAHLEYLELGGPAPDLSHLTAAERERMESLVALLDQTEGIAFGRGLGESQTELSVSTEAGERLLAAVRDALPATARIAIDPAAASLGVPGMNVLEGLIVGTFGGRIRVWLLAGDDPLDQTTGSLEGLDRIFLALPDTAALALVDSTLDCLLVVPEDCAPNIQVPRGSLVARRYRRPIHPVGEAVSVFVRELIPAWEPMAGFGEGAAVVIDVPPIADDRAKAAVGDQAAAGGRSRKTNPKRKALMELGEDEARALAAMVLAVHDGRARPEDVEHNLRRLATRR